MARKDWKRTVKKSDYVVYRNKRNTKQVAVYRNIFMVLNLKTGQNKNYQKKSMLLALFTLDKYIGRNK